jgi:hypothetical protein
MPSARSRPATRSTIVSKSSSPELVMLVVLEVLGHGVEFVGGDDRTEFRKFPTAT